MALKKIRQERQRLADIVHEQLLTAIQSGAIGAGERLVQEKIAEELDISRTPVREALLRLERDGILATSPRGGFVIRRATNEEVTHIYQARAAIEGYAARLLVLNRNPASHKTLRATIAREEDISSPTVAAYFDANRNIHRCIVKLTGNTYLEEMFDNIWNRSASYDLFAALVNVDLASSLGDHGRIADAIASGDPNEATRVVLEHIEDGLALQLEALGVR